MFVLTAVISFSGLFTVRSLTRVCDRNRDLFYSNKVVIQQTVGKHYLYGGSSGSPVHGVHWLFDGVEFSLIIFDCFYIHVAKCNHAYSFYITNRSKWAEPQLPSTQSNFAPTCVSVKGHYGCIPNIITLSLCAVTKTDLSIASNRQLLWKQRRMPFSAAKSPTEARIHDL